MGARVRVGTWNCRQGIDRKTESLRELGCDVLVVPESAQVTALAQEPGISSAWKGELPRKGLGVFAFNGWSVEPSPVTDSSDWLLPLTVKGPAGRTAFTLLALWTVKRPQDGRPSYAGQLADVIANHRELIETERVVLAGDFNASFQGPSARPHMNNVQALRNLGMRSAYHEHFDVEHGGEPAMTLRWVGPGRKHYEYHCDFIFGSSKLLPDLVSTSVGSMDRWVESGLSDHCPVTADWLTRDKPRTGGTSRVG